MSNTRSRSVGRWIRNFAIKKLDGSNTRINNAATDFFEKIAELDPNNVVLTPTIKAVYYNGETTDETMLLVKRAIKAYDELQAAIADSLG